MQELARLILKIIALQDAMASGRTGPIIRHASFRSITTA